MGFGPRLLAAAVIAVVGLILAHWAGRIVARLITRSNRIDTTFASVAGAVVRYGILIIVLIAALGQLGVQTTSLLAALGAAGLAIGLALQGTLSNIAAGIMLLWLRPFRTGEFIETVNVAGTVEEVSLFHTQIRTWDGIFKFVPNSQLWNVTLTNYSRNPTRLVIIDFGIAYEDDMAAARAVLMETATAHPDVMAVPAAEVVPLKLADSAVVLELRAWAPVAKFWAVRWDLTEAGKKNLDAAGISIPFPQRVVHVVSDALPGPGGSAAGKDGGRAAGGGGF
jgi:small conductance mechanosensitive channel